MIKDKEFNGLSCEPTCPLYYFNSCVSMDSTVLRLPHEGMACVPESVEMRGGTFFVDSAAIRFVGGKSTGRGKTSRSDFCCDEARY